MGEGAWGTGKGALRAKSVRMGDDEANRIGVRDDREPGERARTGGGRVRNCCMEWESGCEGLIK